MDAAARGEIIYFWVIFGQCQKKDMVVEPVKNVFFIGHGLGFFIVFVSWAAYRRALWYTHTLSVQDPLGCGDGSGGHHGSLYSQCARILRGHLSVLHFRCNAFMDICRWSCPAVDLYIDILVFQQSIGGNLSLMMFSRFDPIPFFIEFPVTVTQGSYIFSWGDVEPVFLSEASKRNIRSDRPLSIHL